MKRWLSLLIVPICCGCGEVDVVRVSGRVTLDNKPLPNAHVSFTPLDGDLESRLGATATTDSDGRFTLKTHTSKSDYSGASVGKHRVRITTRGEAPGDATVDDPRYRDKVPPWYNVESKLTFEVPEGGTDQANFSLSSKRPGG